MTRPKPVLTKHDFVRRYEAGEFGNRSPTWNSLSEWLHDGPHSGLYHIRNRVAGGPTWYNLTPHELVTKWFDLVPRSVNAESLYISEMCPTEKTIFQGEVARGLWGYDLLYTRVAKPMRVALAEKSCAVTGIIASCLLRGFLCPHSHEWLMYLLDNYIDHVVEFSTFSVEWGTDPGYNSVFWEVRKF